MESTSLNSIASQLVPITNQHLILPNVAIAEVVSYDATAVESLSHSPDWLLGLLQWRGIKIPLISFERSRGEVMSEPSPSSRFVVLNTLNGKKDSAFVAFLAQGLPQLLQLGADRLKPGDGAEQNNEYVLSGAVVDGESALIPDIDALEKLVADYQTSST
jgi:chemosensory pili system protein ChpC